VRFDGDLLEAIGGPIRAHSALVIQIDEVFHHCARAPLRARLWDPSSWPPDPPRVSKTPDADYADRLYPAPDEEG
jgi:predicted pyridoxine 5'-phosphate oxidase superfamily flavin-nucleotide-binding protein